MSDINLSIKKTLVNEGGFQKRYNDRANWSSGIIGVGTLIGTKYGITALDMPGVDIEGITVDQAIAYYKEHYVKPLYVQVEDQLRIDKIFDMGVLFGVGEAILLLQRILYITQDTQFGPATLMALNQARTIFPAYTNELVAHAYKVVAVHPEDKEALQGWLNRIYS